MRINVGCGRTPTPGWRNFDNSLSLRLARLGPLASLAQRLRLLDSNQVEFIRFARANNVEYGDVRGRLPIPDHSAEVLYSSHMLEHLDRREAVVFLAEARRVLRPGGIIRLVVPDLRKLAVAYISDGDANAFVERTLMWTESPKTTLDMVRRLIIGARGHKWMYDGESLCGLLRAHGFVDPRISSFGETVIGNPEMLDLHERGSESICVEAFTPPAGVSRVRP